MMRIYNRRPWTAEEDEIAGTMWADGATAVEIGIRLCRLKDAVLRRKAQCGWERDEERGALVVPLSYLERPRACR